MSRQVKIEGNTETDISKIWEETENSFSELVHTVQGTSAADSTLAPFEDDSRDLNEFIEEIGRNLVADNNVAAAVRMNKLTKKLTQLHSDKISLIKNPRKMLAYVVTQSMAGTEPTATTIKGGHITKLSP